MYALLVANSQNKIAFMQGSSILRDRLPWDDVRLFLALCRSSTLGEAGRRLGVDGSTMSRRLVTLEEALATTLFERGRTGIVATEAAERLMPVAEEMEHVMARFTGEAETFEREIAGRVRIACPADAASVLVAPLLPALLQRHQHLQVDLDATERVVDMARRDADLALRTARPTQGDLVVTRLFPVGWSLAVSPDVAARVGTLRAWADIPWITGSERSAQTTPGRWCAEHLQDIEPTLRSDSLTVQITAATIGLGAALIPNLSLEHYGLVPLPLTRRLRASVGPWPQDDLYLVTHRTLRGVPRVRAVWEFLLEHAPGRLRKR